MLCRELWPPATVWTGFSFSLQYTVISGLPSASLFCVVSSVSEISCLPHSWFNHLFCKSTIFIRFQKYTVQETTETYYVMLADFKLTVFLAQPLQCWDYKHMPSHPAEVKFLNNS
jgi:hypothetical protein